jgi:hypothetical protein
MKKMQQDLKLPFLWLKAIRQYRNHVQELCFLTAILAIIVLSLEFEIKHSVNRMFLFIQYPLGSAVSFNLLYYFIFSVGCILILYLQSGKEFNNLAIHFKKNLSKCFFGFILLDLIIECPDMLYITVTQNMEISHIFYTVVVTLSMIWLYCRFCFFLFFLVHHKTSVIKSFCLSFQLTRHHVFKIMVMLCVPLLVMLLMYASTIYISNIGAIGVRLLQLLILAIAFPGIIFAHVEFAEQYSVEGRR